MKQDLIGLTAFLGEFPSMSVVPSRTADLRLRGLFEFTAKSDNGPEISDSYQIEIAVPHSFPSAIPVIRETGNKIPRDGHQHVNPNGSLCLGSPLRLLTKLQYNPTLVGFARNCLIPYLYGLSRKANPADKFYMGELDHGEPGIIDDYRSLLGLPERHQILKALALLGLKKRIANKRPCPCDCGKRLGVCRTRYRLNRYRTLAPRSWFRRHAKNPGSGM